MNGRKQERGSEPRGKEGVGPEVSVGEGEHYRPAPKGFRQEWKDEGIVEKLDSLKNALAGW